MKGSTCYTDAMEASQLDELKKRAISGNYLVHGTPDNADCVVAMSFGFRTIDGSIEPGLSNQDIANVIHKHYLALPKITQFEVADGLAADDERIGVFRIEKHTLRGEYLDTREVAVQAKVIMDSHGWKQAIIFAHPYHMPRVDLVCQKLGIDTVVPDNLNSIRFDSRSDQEWTRDAVAWAEYETRAIDYYANKDWI
jgi:hypothetical protein